MVADSAWFDREEQTLRKMQISQISVWTICCKNGCVLAPVQSPSSHLTLVDARMTASLWLLMCRPSVDRFVLSVACCVVQDGNLSSGAGSCSIVSTAS